MIEAKAQVTFGSDEHPIQADLFGRTSRCTPKH